VQFDKIFIILEGSDIEFNKGREWDWDWRSISSSGFIFRLGGLRVGFGNKNNRGMIDVVLNFSLLIILICIKIKKEEMGH